MDGSPVGDALKNTSLRLFGYELRETTERPIQPGRGLDLLPKARIPDDMDWARPNPRVADALARWSAAVDREATAAVSPQVRQLVLDRLVSWSGEKMPMSRTWVDDEIDGLKGEDYHIAKLILVVSLASYQFDHSLVEGLGSNHDEQRLIRILAFAAMSAARRLADHAAKNLNTPGVGIGLQPAVK
jgi:hypothetical protein